MAERAEFHGPKLSISPSTLNDVFDKATAEAPDKIAIVARHQPNLFECIDDSLLSHSKEHLSLNYRQLQFLASTFANGLRQRGVRHGDAVATLLRNRVEWIIAFWACARIGATLVSLDPRILAHSDVFQHCIGLTSPSALIVANPKDASSVNALLSGGEIPLRIIAPGPTDIPISWCSMHDILREMPHHVGSTSPSCSTGKETCLILFTSGTTGLPKACPINTENILGGINSASYLRDLRPERKLLLQMPIYHVAGLTHAMAFWSVGATVVIPSESFNATESLRSISAEKCTDVTLVPAILQALHSSPEMTEKSTESVLSVAIGGTPVSPADVAMMHKAFPLASLQIYFGMTEGVFVIGWSSSKAEPLEEKGLMSIGRPLPGCRAKICAAGSHEALAADQVGELHISGFQLIQGYLKHQGTDFHTDDEGLQWIKTGDHAKMVSSGAVYILGRYKDVIIRGGENISPVYIENALNSIRGVKSQVVGAADEIAGEVPVAILDDTSTSNSPAQSSDVDLYATVIDKCGADHGLGDIIRLSDLGLSGFPTTPSGKVEKAKLKALVATFLEDRTHTIASTDSSTKSTVQDLRELWSKLLGPVALTLPEDKSLQGIADSITLMRGRNQIKHQWGTLLSIPALMDDNGLSHQASLLNKSRNSSVSTMQSGSSNTSYPWSTAPETPSLSFAQDNTKLISSVKQMASPLLNSMGYSWDEDVEDATPANHEHFGKSERPARPASWNQRKGFIIPNTSVTTTRHVMERVLSLPHWSIKRSLSVKISDDLTVLTMLKPSTKLFDNIISELPSIGSRVDFNQLLINLDASACFPGPYFKLFLVSLRDQEATGMIMQDFHGMTDVVTHSNLMEDIALALKSDERSLPTRIPYQYYGNMVYLHQQSVLASASIDWQVENIQSASHYIDTVWPRQKCPVEFIGAHVDSVTVDGQRVERKPIDDKDKPNIVHELRSFDQLPVLESEFGLVPFQILRSAFILFNTHMSGADAAVFGQVEASRTWPYMEEWMQDILGDPVDICGGIARIPMTFHQVDKSMSVLDFFKQVDAQQAALAKHSVYDDKAVDVRLDDRGRRAHKLRWHNMLNWAPYVRRFLGDDWQPYDEIEHVKTALEAESSIAWRCGMTDSKTLGIWAFFDKCQLSHDEMTDAASLLMRYVEMLVLPEMRYATLQQVIDRIKAGSGT